MSDLNLVLCQMTSVDSVDENLAQILSLLTQIPNEFSPDLVSFPENALYMRLEEGSPIQGITLQDPAIMALAAEASQRNTYLHIGSVPLRTPKESRLKNASLLLGPSGEIKVSYEKMHLFDIELEGQKPIRESDVFDPGEDPQIFQVKGWKIGQTICYDLRFSELFSVYAREEVDLILVPSAFLVKTGQAHWETLLRARAIESQCYIAAAAQAGLHKSDRGQRHTYGHSLLVDPWGHIIAQGSSDTPQVICQTLNRKMIAQVRQQIPMKKHRRSSLS